MKSIWILAAADAPKESPEGTVITMEPAEETAQTATKADGTNGTQKTEELLEKPPQNPWLQMTPFLILIVVMYFLLFRGPRKRQQEHQKMVSSLKKNDRIRTIGGIYGTVIEVRDDEVIVKVDESSNTRLRMAPSAVAVVLTDDKK